MNESPPVPLASPAAPVLAPQPAGPPAVTPSASTTVPLFGGMRGGRPRKDGLPAGSEEAKAADRLKNAERMQRARERERLAQPPQPLPANLDTPEPGAALPGGGSPAPAGDLGAVPGAGPVPWRPETLKPLCEQGLALWEELIVSQAAKQLKGAGVPNSIIAKIEKDGRFPALAKKGIETSAPPIIARAMNKTGISSEHQDSLILCGALLALMQHQKSFQADVRTLIAEAKPGDAKPVTPGSGSNAAHG